MPEQRGDITARDVLAAPEGAERDRAIDAWCQSVWHAFGHNRQTIVDLLRDYDVA